MRALKTYELSAINGGSPTQIPFPDHVVTDPAAIANLIAQATEPEQKRQVHNQLN